jgi:hypothetical protein
MEDYLFFLQATETENVVTDIIDDVLNATNEKIKELHIESFLVPSLVNFSRDVIDQTLEIEFFEKDSVDVEEGTWIPDLGTFNYRTD